MGVSTSNSKQTSCNIMAQDAEGLKQCVASVTFSLRHGQGMALMVDIHEADLMQANLDAVQEKISEFTAAAFAEAQDSGIPVPAL